MTQTERTLTQVQMNLVLAYFARYDPAAAISHTEYRNPDVDPLLAEGSVWVVEAEPATMALIRALLFATTDESATLAAFKIELDLFKEYQERTDLERRTS